MDGFKMDCFLGVRKLDKPGTYLKIISVNIAYFRQEKKIN